MRLLKIQSPAKLNLCLKIVRRRHDGYHELVSVFHRISLKDTLILKKTEQGVKLRTNHPRVPTDERNLIVKAYRSLQSLYPRLGGVHITLTKRIPVGGGLGGGSSNAAFFLLGMKKLYRLPVSRRQLFKVGEKLGADVPFFLYEVNQAVARGCGERLRKQPLKARLKFLLIISDKELSTKKVYKSLRVSGRAGSLTKINHTVKMLCFFLGRKKISQAYPLMNNDLEKSAFSLEPSIRKTVEKLRRLKINVRMSGSGPTLFVLLPFSGKAQEEARIKQELPGVRIEKVHTC